MALGLGIVRRLKGEKGFVLLPRRTAARVIERFFGWLIKHRRAARSAITRAAPTSWRPPVTIAAADVLLRRIP